MEIHWLGCASQNFRAGRPSNLAVEAVVIHLIDGSQAACDATFLNPSLANPVSAHYSIGKQGRVHQYVKEEDTAYHAGKIVSASWPEMKRTAAGGFVNPNYYTIGIEHEGKPNDDWSDAMYASSATLLRAISARYPALNTLTRGNVVMHRQIRADKSCPGFKADLDRLIREASGAPAEPPLQPLDAAVTVTSALNLRDRPSVSGAVHRVLPAGTVVAVTGSVRGDAVRKSTGEVFAGWYRTAEAAYLWSGATDKPLA